MPPNRRSPAKNETDSDNISGHAIKRWIYRNTVSYFMRLPDGSPQGTGYVATAEQSPKRLHEEAIRLMTSIDNSTTYLGWSDLRAPADELWSPIVSGLWIEFMAV